MKRNESKPKRVKINWREVDRLLRKQESTYRLTAGQVRQLRVILLNHITPWMARDLCRLALKGLKR